MNASASPTPRWRREPEKRPAQILDAALKVFAEKGLGGARMEDIAEAAGLSKATIYLYFPSKVDVFREMMRNALDGLVQVSQIAGTEQTARDALRSLVAAYWREVRSPRFEAVYRLVMSEVPTFPELAKEYVHGVRIPVSERVMKILDRGVADGSFTPGDNEVRVRMLVALLAKHAVWCMRREFIPDLKGRSDDEVLEEVLTFFFQAMEASGTA